MRPGAKYAIWLAARHLPLALATIGLGTAASYSALQFLPHQFTASTYLLVETAAVYRDNRKPADAAISTAQLQGIEARLRTTERLTLLGDTVGLSSPAEELQKVITFDTQSGRDKATTMEISVTHTDGQLAADAANHLGQQVLSEHQTLRNEQIEQSLAFFRQEVSDAKAELESAFQAVLAFKTAQAGFLPDDAGRYLDQRKALINQKPPSPQPAKPNPAFARIEAELKAANSLYSARHPRVRALMAELGETEPFLGAPNEAKQPAPADLTQIDAALALIPANGLRLDALTSTYDLARQHYETALSRLETAAIDARIAERAKADRITIVEAASPPALPSGSRRKIAFSAGLALSCILALIAMILRQRADPYIRRPQDIRTGLNITPYAVIPS